MNESVTHENATLDYARALKAEFEAFNEWARNPDINNVNKDAYERANSYRKFVMRQMSASQHVETSRQG